MNFQEALLILITISSIIGIPVYLYFRSGMVRDQGTKNVAYSGKRVLKLTGINLIVNLSGAALFSSLLADMLLRIPNISQVVIINSFLFLGMIALAFYGSGIYITSIVLEAFTLPQLRAQSKFKTQFIATHLFHGPVSHIFIFSGYQIALFILAVMDLSFAKTTSTFLAPILLAGFVSGVMFGLAQIYNGTAPYQFITGTTLLILFGWVVGSRLSFLYLPPITAYFLTAAVGFVATIIIYFGILGLKGKKINWDKSGY